MNRIGCFAAAMAFLVYASDRVHAQSEVLACEIAAWSPEVLEFFGDSATINKRLHQYDSAIALDVRRVFLVIVETKDDAQVSYFERAQDDKGKWTVKNWTTNSAEGFKKDLHSALLSREGKGCAGVMAHELLGKEAADGLKAGKDFNSSGKASDAVKHVSPAGEEPAKKYKRVTLVVLC